MTVGGTGRSAWPRSYLYCPGDRPDRLARAAAGAPTRVIADLEDSVHAAQARRPARAAGGGLAALRRHAGKGQRRAMGACQSGDPGRRRRRRP